MQSEARSFDDEYDLTEASDISFDIAAEEAGDDFGQKMAYVEELAGTGALTAGELAETLRQQQYEITQLRNENTLLKKKLLDAARMGFKV
jgi:flagellar biosynthesis protein FlhG